MFLDTSGLLSLFDSSDAFHDISVREYRRATRLITHNYVLAELAALVNARKLPRWSALNYLCDLLDNPAWSTDKPVKKRLRESRR